LTGNGGVGDRFNGGLDDDTMTGGAGADAFAAFDGGSDRVHAFGGNDFINVRDNVGDDTANAGDGTDECRSDAGDTISSCEVAS
jgi:hypothetical protein